MTRNIGAKLSLVLAPMMMFASAIMPAEAQSGRHHGHSASYYRTHHRGGIGPGKGALIGGASGAAIGGLAGRSGKSAVIGGAVGAGVGAIAGKVHQNRVRARDGN